MNDTNQPKISWITSIIMWILWAIILIAMACILFAPLFLPTIEFKLKNKYAKFTYKNDLVKEEMESYRKIAWIACIIGWILFLSIAMFSNYGG